MHFLRGGSGVAVAVARHIFATEVSWRVRGVKRLRFESG